MNSKIYVGNLSYDIENSDLENLFANVGDVKTVNVIKDRDTGRARGFGFVEMQSANEAEKAIADLHETEFMGRSLIVNIANPQRRQMNNRY
jgi:RNA recognition motif-containing protein